MKKIGLIGGISWESTVDYYRILNQEVNRRLGGFTSAEILMYSFNFEEIIEMNDRDDVEGIGRRLIEESQKIEIAGADCLMLGANTAHRWADRIQKKISIPIIHIAEATGREIQKAGVNNLALLGTKYTMEGDFIKGILNNMFPDRIIIARSNSPS